MQAIELTVTWVSLCFGTKATHVSELSRGEHPLGAHTARRLFSPGAITYLLPLFAFAARELQQNPASCMLFPYGPGHSPVFCCSMCFFNDSYFSPPALVCVRYFAISWAF